ncbi:MAG: hypothetical protein AAF763_13410 [Pseudomonadota bacterium]
MPRWEWDEDKLLPAERRVVDALRNRDWDENGEIEVGESDYGGKLPEAGDETRRLTAEVVKALALGRALNVELPDTGLNLHGGWITGQLSLEGAAAARDIGLLDCRFELAPIFRSARLQSLFLNRSELPGLRADRVDTRGGLFLNGSKVFGEVRLPGATIKGDLVCDEAVFETTNVARQSVILNADDLRVRGSLFLTRARIRGQVRFVVADIGSNLSCAGTIFEHQKGRALILDGTRVDGAFFLREGARIVGALDMSGAQLGSICDDPACWPTTGNLMLHRCLYSSFTGGPVDSEARLRWLALQVPARWGQNFWPQPYEQCAKVLHEMGHTSDARAVLIEKERLQRADRRKRMHPARRAVRWTFDNLMGATTLYGRQPLLAFAWLFGFWLLGFGLFNDADRFDALKSNNAFVLRADEWTECAADGLRRADHASQRECFEAQPEGSSYPHFNALIYSADTLLPVVDLEMQGFWIPDAEAPWLHAKTTRTYLWLHIALGWALSLLAVAGFSGLVKSD